MKDSLHNYYFLSEKQSKKTRSKCHSTHPTVKYIDCNVIVLAADDDAYQINYTIIYNPYIGTIKILILS